MTFDPLHYIWHNDYKRMREKDNCMLSLPTASAHVSIWDWSNFFTLLQNREVPGQEKWEHDAAAQFSEQADWASQASEMSTQDSEAAALWAPMYLSPESSEDEYTA